MAKLNLGVLISGRGSNLEAILKAIESDDLDARVSVVISNNDSAKGLEVARSFGVTTFALDIGSFPSRDAYEKEVVRLLAAQSVDYVVLAGYMRLVGQDLLSAFQKRIINIHPSLLPSFKGLNAQKQALEFGAKVSGCTVHFVNEFLDSGPIILQQAVDVLETDTPESLSDRILAQEHALYPKALQLLAEGRIQIDENRVVIKETAGEGVN